MNFVFALAAKSDTSFFEDVWNYLYDVYISSEGSYENLGFEKMPLFSLRLTVLGIFIGMIIACVAMAYHKKVLGGVVRRLIEAEALSPNTAKGAAELGYAKNFLIKNALERSTSLRSIVKCVGEEEFLAAQTEQEAACEEDNGEQRAKKRKKMPRDYVIDANSDKFYIPEEKRIRAEIKFEKKGSGWLATAIAIIFVIILFFAVLLVLPWILGYVDKML